MVSGFVYDVCRGTAGRRGGGCERCVLLSKASQLGAFYCMFLSFKRED